MTDKNQRFSTVTTQLLQYFLNITKTKIEQLASLAVALHNNLKSLISQQQNFTADRNTLQMQRHELFENRILQLFIGLLRYTQEGEDSA